VNVTTGPQTLIEGLRLHDQQIEDRIATAYSQILEAQERCDCSDAQVRHVFNQEALWGDDGRLTTRWIFMHYIEAQARHPKSIGVNIGEKGEAPHTCRCADIGFIIDLKTDKPVPCPDCNTALYELYSAGCLRPNHECERCRPKDKRRRARAGDTHRTEISAEHHEDEQKAVTSELFGAGESF
jgi:hypothetical protein